MKEKSKLFKFFSLSMALTIARFLLYSQLALFRLIAYVLFVLCDFIDKVVSYALFLSQNPTPGCKWTLVKYEVKPVLLPVDIQRISS